MKPTQYKVTYSVGGVRITEIKTNTAEIINLRDSGYTIHLIVPQTAIDLAMSTDDVINQMQIEFNLAEKIKAIAELRKKLDEVLAQAKRLRTKISIESRRKII